MARFCELTGKGPMKGSIIWRSGKAKKSGGIGTHVTAITKRRFLPNLQRVKARLPNGEVRYVRVATTALKKGLITVAHGTGHREVHTGLTHCLVTLGEPADCGMDPRIWRSATGWRTEVRASDCIDTAEDFVEPLNR